MHLYITSTRVSVLNPTAEIAWKVIYNPCLYWPWTNRGLLLLCLPCRYASISRERALSGTPRSALLAYFHASMRHWLAVRLARVPAISMRMLASDPSLLSSMRTSLLGPLHERPPACYPPHSSACSLLWDICSMAVSLPP